MAPKTDMTGKLLLLAAAACALLSLTALTGQVLDARNALDSAEDQVRQLRADIAALESGENEPIHRAGESLKMIRPGEKLILFGP